MRIEKILPFQAFFEGEKFEIRISKPEIHQPWAGRNPKLECPEVPNMKRRQLF
jgi:hypothetical protein